VAPRLSHILNANRKFKEAMKENRAALCTVDTWLLNKLRNFSVQTTNFECITDISNATATGLYDAFNLEYNALNLKLFGIKRNMLSTTVSNSHDFGLTHASLFGAPVRIGAIIADQAASLIGNACFRKMDVKVTLGTGTFLNVNTGGKCRGSCNGANPMIAWNIQSREKNEKISSTVFYTERSFNESSALIRFAKTIGLCSREDELSSQALSVADSNGVIFIPKFQSMAGFVGYKQSTSRSHLVRAILESIVFKVAEFFFLMREENRDYRAEKIRIDGGISANDFICQSIADLLNISIERGVNSSEITSVGCAYLAAFNCGMFESLEHAEKFYKIEKVFVPIESNHRELFERFKRFIDIFRRDIKF
jgi:putative glycerol kinase 5